MKRTFEENAANFYRYSALKSNTHYDMAESYKSRHRAFGVVVVCVTTIVGTSVFASLGERPQLWLQISTGLLSVGAVVLAALQTFLGFSEQQSQHKTSASGYGVCRRDLEILMMKYPDATGAADEPGTQELEEIKNSLDDLDRASPTIPESVWNSVVKKTPIEKKE